MRRPNRLAAVLVGTLATCIPTLAGAQAFVYPARGQSSQQQEFDRGQCYSWDVQQSGFDPANPRVAAGAPPPQPGMPQGGLFRGAADGAAMGAVGGAIGGDAGKGAAIGAAVGGLFGMMRRLVGPRNSSNSNKATRRSSRAPWPRAIPPTTAHSAHA